MVARRRALFRIDAFRLALYVGLALTGVHVLDVLWARKGSALPVVSRIEYAAQDYAMVSLRGPRTPSGDVVIVAIDERSIGAEGLWPWSRSRLARLVDALAEAGATVIGFDMIWSDADVVGTRLAAVARQVKAARGQASGEEAVRLERIWRAAQGDDPAGRPDAEPTGLLADAIERVHAVTIGFMFRTDPPSPEEARQAVERLAFFRTSPVHVLGPGGRHRARSRPAASEPRATPSRAW